MFVAMLSPREQGDLGELSALEWLVAKGAHCYLPLGHSPDVDIVADLGEGFVGVQVKTTGHRVNNRFQVTLATRGGNQSWNRITKRFSCDRCDYVFVLASDGRRWFIPSDRIEGAVAVNLGGPKYAEFEIERGRPFADRRTRRSLDSVAARRDTEAVKRDAL